MQTLQFKTEFRNPASGRWD